MPKPFTSFVVLAEMRTGSNFLEANLNAFDGIECLGEAFNPAFIGYPTATDIHGISKQERDAKPRRLLRAIQSDSGTLQGFRYFHDHDPRVLDDILNDPKCAKIILTRNPLDSYVSWKIAQATGQWKLTNVKKRREAQAEFNADEFEAHVTELQQFQVTVMHRLQKSGQAAFYIAYEDLQDVEVFNGLAKWLGVDQSLDSLNKSLKRQNPEPVIDKVANPDDMRQGLARLDRFNLTRTPAFEPRRGPMIPSYVAGAKTPLLYMPIRSGPELAVRQWMAALDGVDGSELGTKFNRAELTGWKRDRPGHRSFTVVRHPVARAHAVFCAHLLRTGPGAMLMIRRALIRQHDVPLPAEWPDPNYGRDEHREAFSAFLRFVRANLAGQTAVRVDNHWASQSQCLMGMADYNLPDMIVREDEMDVYLPSLAMQVGHLSPPDPEPVPNKAPFALADIYDDQIEALAQEAYQRDYTMFGFRDWD
ncbi:nodulation protein NodH [Pseudoprimorskyibacter insulae]|uniref:Nodulation protein NodH n=1 Tax=Pseudoprimorskyibacter insulae TaxID=1695997 RepID=A0A2R8ATL4_9RHOB|nr:nodulation protein NodH [Pseudoprimorskyibacter insulae]SPF79368.1 hypothetical protein PRI8871_01163 [Pseudoprimorskyibacter insulae]